MRKRLIAIAIIAMLGVGLSVSSASADPSPGFGPIAVDCGAGVFHVVGAPGNGQFAAAPVIGSTAVLVPLAFMNAQFTFTGSDGTVYPTFFEPATVKGSGKKAGTWCSFTFDIDTGNGLENFSGSGDVYAKFTPGK